MTPLFTKIILFALIPFGMMIIGGIIAVIKKPSGNLRSLILHFAAGVVFSVLGVELLPDVMREHAPFQIIAGFIAGFILMILVRKFTEGKSSASGNGEDKKLPFTLLIPVTVDIFIDGLLLGIGFFAGNKEGILLAIALSFELFSLGMATSIELQYRRITKTKSIITVICVALVFFASAVLGATLLHNLPQSALEVMLSFGIAALLFLVTEELLTEAHEEEETVWHTSAFFTGFLLFLLLGMFS
jgi:ZIP family zinc transporter